MGDQKMVRWPGRVRSRTLSKLRAKLASCAAVASCEVNLTAPHVVSSCVKLSQTSCEADLPQMGTLIMVIKWPEGDLSRVTYSFEASSKKLYVKLAKLALSEVKLSPRLFSASLLTYLCTVGGPIQMAVFCISAKHAKKIGIPDCPRKDNGLKAKIMVASLSTAQFICWLIRLNLAFSSFFIFLPVSFSHAYPSHHRFLYLGDNVKTDFPEQK